MKELSALALARLAGRLALQKKGFDVRILKLRRISSICDYFVVASGAADVQVKAIARAIHDGLAELGYKPYYREGMNEGNWEAMDYLSTRRGL